MLCEKCAREVGSAVCSSCGKTVDLLGPFCYHCGSRIARQAGQDAATPESDQEVDFSARLLCSDGTCIGVIDEHGTCKVCGKPYTHES